jgi:hypothetical protein
MAKSYRAVTGKLLFDVFVAGSWVKSLDDDSLI